MVHESAECSRTADSIEATVVTLFIFLSIPLAGLTWSTADAPVRPEWSQGLRIGVDPNTAPWWELTALPGIGESTARNIVAYRESRPDPTIAFQRPHDLEPVPDVGVKTIRRIAPHLRFDPP